MVFFAEALVLCILFTLMVVPSVVRDPEKWISDYPPKVRAYLKEQGRFSEEQTVMTPKVIVRKVIFSLFAVCLLTLAVVFLNGAAGFRDGFFISYGLWLVVTWYDALILDCLWFARSKKIRLKGTEDMEEAYRDYGFHIRMSLIGSIIGLPVCLLTGLLTEALLRML